MSGVSLAIPCRDHWQYLDECLASVMAQTHADWEAMVVDDGSTAPGFDAAQARWPDPRICWLRHDASRGPGPARNTAIRAARHEIVVTLDSDDLLAPDYLAKLLPHMESDPSLDCVFPDFEFFGCENRRHEFRERDHAELARWQYLPAQVMMRKALWERVGGYSEAAVLRAGNEDWEFWIAAAAKGFRAAHHPEPLYRYRTKLASTTTRLRSVDYQTREFIYARHSAFIDAHLGRAQFLGAGYWHSARSACEERRPLRALWLGARAFRHIPELSRASSLLRKAATTALPAPVLALARALRGKRTLAAGSA